MRHIQAGVVVAAGFALILIITMMIWRGLVGWFGTEVATGVVALVFVVGTAVALIDWLSERRT